MADDSEIVLDIKVNGDDAIKKTVNSTKQLKAEIKDLKSQMLNLDEGSKAFVSAANRVGQLQDKLAAVNESSKSLAGNGIENVRNSFSSLSQAFQTADFSKITTSFKSLGTAINGSTILLSAIIAIITYVVQNFDELSKKAGILGSYLRLLAAAFEYVSDKISEFTDWLGLTNNALEKQTQSVIDNSQKQLAVLTDRYDKEIALAKAAGKDVVELEIKKQNAIIDSARIQLNAIKKLAEANGDVSQEQLKQVESLSKSIKDAGATINTIRAEQQKKQQDDAEKSDKEHKDNLEKQYKEHLDKLKAAESDFAEFKKGINTDIENELAKTAEQKLELEKKRDISELESKLTTLKENGVKQNIIEEERLLALQLIKEKYAILENDLLAKKSADIDAYYAGEADKALKDAETKKAIQDKANIDWYANEATKSINADANRSKDLAKQKQTFNDTLRGAQTLTNSLAALSDGLFAAKSKNLTKGSAEEKAVLKKQFNVAKGFQIANAVISGIQGAISTYNSLSVIPIVGPILGAAAAAVVGVSTALQINKIKNTKFDDGGGGDTSSVEAPRIDTSSSTPQPVAQTPSLNLTGTGESGTKVLSDNSDSNTSNNPPVVKAFVLESDITDNQKRQAAIDRRSTL